MMDNMNAKQQTLKINNQSVKHLRLKSLIFLDS
uniref:Uncharacterized protein n=1 Tax=Tetranychus urticae TaxID=32264 RepID=T1KBM7_TETUR